MSAYRPVLVIAGLGTGGGTGGAVARLFAKERYSVALIARGGDSLKNIADEINSSGGNAESFPIQSYSASNIASAWKDIRARYPTPEYSIRVAVFNAAVGIWKPFLEVTPEDVQAVTQTSIEASFAFSREAILDFKQNSINETTGKRGSLIFTGATAALRGNTNTSAFSSGKFAVRALSQSLAKEFGRENIHVSHAVIDGVILTAASRQWRNDPEWENNPDIRLTPEGIASSYLYLANQPRSAWTWELDLRPAHEKWS